MRGAKDRDPIKEDKLAEKQTKMAEREATKAMKKLK